MQNLQNTNIHDVGAQRTLDMRNRRLIIVAQDKYFNVNYENENRENT